jgi:hypothetical protein
VSCHGILGAKLDFEGTSAWAGQAQVNVLEPRLLAVAAIIDGEISTLEPDLGQIAAIEAKCAEAVDPGEEGGKILLDAALRLAGAVYFGCGRTPRRSDKRGRRRQRMLLGAGRYRDCAVRFDPHRKLCADQIQSLGARVSAEQARARESDFGLGRACDHSPVAVAHHDVAHPHGRPAMLVAFQHCARDLDAEPISEILRNRRRQPRRGDIE